MTEPPFDLAGVVRLRRELIADIMTDTQIATLVRAKVLKRVRYGAFVDHAVWESLGPEDRHRVLARGVLATAHTSTALTHASSIIERRIPLWGSPLDVVHTTRTGPEDFAWPDLGVFVEFDGRAKDERYRRDGESLEDFLMREKAREELVCLLTGWTCIRITWADLRAPEKLATRIRAVIATRNRVAF